MSVKARCSAAIGKAGGWLKFKKTGQGFSVMASLQPVLSSPQEISSSAGFGTLRKYNLFVCDGAGVNQLGQGDEVGFGGWSFRLLTIEPIHLGREVAYYQGFAVLIEEGDRIG